MPRKDRPNAPEPSAAPARLWAPPRAAIFWPHHRFNHRRKRPHGVKNLRQRFIVADLRFIK
ncbi:hypothetical protein EQV97_18580 [Pseudomonas sp. TMW22090]|nr:hypothetical protein [Pseudomonas sp. TMW22090]